MEKEQLTCFFDIKHLLIDIFKLKIYIPIQPIGMVYLQIKACMVVLFHFIYFLYNIVGANTEDLDQTPRSAAFAQSLLH